MRCLSVIFSAFLLSACAMDPSPIPAGYTHHQNDYKSPEGPKRTMPSIAKEQDEQK